jgi:hypothetical protein
MTSKKARAAGLLFWRNTLKYVSVRMWFIPETLLRETTMNLLAIVGSPRKGKATDILVDRAIEGAKTKAKNCDVKKLNLIDYEIKHCKNCLACRESQTEEPVARCSIRDDMDVIKEDILKSDRLVLATPVHSGFATALMTSFLERITWTFAKPKRKILTLSGCPLPRSDKKRNSAIRPLPLSRGLSGIRSTQKQWETCTQVTLSTEGWSITSIELLNWARSWSSPSHS